MKKRQKSTGYRDKKLFKKTARPRSLSGAPGVQRGGTRL